MRSSLLVLVLTGASARAESLAEIRASESPEFKDLTVQQCIEQMKSHHALVTEDTQDCYHVSKYSVIAKKQQSAGSAFSPFCHELRDLNWAILASFSDQEMKALRDLGVHYSKKINQAKPEDKFVMMKQLSQEIEEKFPLVAVAICSLNTTLFLQRDTSAFDEKVSTTVQMKEKGTYYFAQELFHSVDDITNQRDVATGRAVPPDQTAGHGP